MCSLPLLHLGSRFRYASIHRWLCVQFPVFVEEVLDLVSSIELTLCH
jgi:hypothetical protein